MSILKNRKAVIFTAAVLSIVGLIWFAVAHWPVTASVGATWPTKSKTHTLLLRPASSKESTRLVDYAPDHQTITGMRIEYRDGHTALVSYKDGKPTTITAYFPDTDKVDTSKLVALKNLSDGLAQRQLASVIVLKDDGKTVKAMTSYQKDGSYAAVGVRDSTDDFAVTEYGPNGVTGVAVFSGTDGSLKSEQDFRDDGTVATSFVTVNTGGPQATETYFDAAGLKTKEVLYNSDYDVVINEFGADGKTVITKTAFGYNGVTVTSYDATGTTPVLEREYVDDTHINVRFFDKSGNATMKQLWVKLDTTQVTPDQVAVVNDGFVLNEVYEYHSDGISTKVDVTFYPGGKTVKEYETRPTTNWRPKTDQHFRADGSLDYTEDCPAEGPTWTDCKTTKMPDAPNKVRAKVPADYYKVTPLMPAPAVKKPTIPALTLTVDLS
jgi:hypothetical protein